jgi:Family of unknown function (DUF6527)
MKLIDLKPKFVRYEERQETWRRLKPGIDPLRGNWTDDDFEDFTGMREYSIYVETIAEAQGIWFLCPKCFADNSGPVGTHRCNVTFAGRGVPDHLGSHNEANQPSRWTVAGTEFANLTLSPSIALSGGGCAWHGWITNGDAT